MGVCYQIPFFNQNIANNKIAIMKRLLLLIFGLISTLSVFGQSIEGSWNGQLDAGGNKLRLIVNIVKRDSVYAGTMDSPEQGAKGIPLSKVHLIIRPAI